ncbi:hypothetical protein CKO51_21230 [Rhodopirellula sp. SM50]|nr:hypothetical protein CKO51_21230 [Rhodopirellula sp. SM50]
MACFIQDHNLVDSLYFAEYPNEPLAEESVAADQLTAGQVGWANRGGEPTRRIAFGVSDRCKI